MAKSEHVIYRPENYRRFDYKTPGSWLKESGKSIAQAARLYDKAMSSNKSRAMSDLGKYMGSNVGRVTRGELNTDKVYKNLSREASDQTARMKAYFKEMGLPANASEDQRAMAVDAYHRSIQQQNQMPKNARGFAGSIWGKMLPMALGLISGNPALGGIFGAVAGGATGGLKGAALGGLSGYGAATLPGTVKNYLSKFTGSGGFTNPGALGLDPSSLYQPGSLPSTTPAVSGFEGLSPASLYAPQALAGLDFIPQPGLEGLTPDMLYNPQSLGGNKPSGDNFDPSDLLDFIPGGGATSAPPDALYSPTFSPTAAYIPQEAGASTIYPGFFGDNQDPAQLLQGSGVGGQGAGNYGNILRRAQPYNVFV